MVRGVRQLSFGLVLPGVPRPVARTDAGASGEFSIRGQKNSLVLLEFSLPAALTGPGGAAMPVSFGANDGGYSATGAIGSRRAPTARSPCTCTRRKVADASTGSGASSRS